MSFLHIFVAQEWAIEGPAPVLYLLCYSFLIHLGMIIWLVSGIVSIAKKEIHIERSSIKITCALFGLIAEIPILVVFFTNLDEDLGEAFSLSNLPAALLFGSFFHESEILMYSSIVFWLMFSFIGGWGIGQFVEWTIGKLRR